MPKDHEFSVEVKAIIFKVIRYVESEKSGAVIPLFNVNERLVAMLGISAQSVKNLKHEMITQPTLDELIDESTESI
ncbi:unnamed protein product [Didymodactylos carnosus]|uniref:Uncharacterized protein n=2 Tax=Didymodactylos carnosus TaxID=1234261 RepID=A0A815ZP66_9BILA|nr:unnamed protein product [Didymodactylos carnosus]CAF4455257.1 unnamed protein product [Didymodactylos carnosus]